MRPVMRRAAIPGTTPFRCYAATLTDLAPGQAVTYRVLKKQCVGF